MDFESREMYRQAIEKIAPHSDVGEIEVARRLVRHTRDVKIPSLGTSETLRDRPSSCWAITSSMRLALPRVLAADRVSPRARNSYPAYLSTASRTKFTLSESRSLRYYGGLADHEPGPNQAASA